MHVLLALVILSFWYRWALVTVLLLYSTLLLPPKPVRVREAPPTGSGSTAAGPSRMAEVLLVWIGWYAVGAAVNHCIWTYGSGP